MTAPVTTVPAAAPRGEIAPADALLVVAILIAGAAAAYLAMPALWVASPVVAGLVCYSSLRLSRANRVQLGGEEGAPFPPELQRCVDAAIEQLAPGEARQRMANVIRQARPLFATRESAFDSRMEHDTREDVTELVAAVCETALELSRLDGAAPERGTDDLSARYQRARESLVTRLRDAATALSEMYASGVEHGTPASDRVAELAAEVRADARARRAAVDELSS